MEVVYIGMMALGGSTLAMMTRLIVSNVLFNRRPVVYGNTLPWDYPYVKHRALGESKKKPNQSPQSGLAGRAKERLQVASKKVFLAGVRVGRAGTTTSTRTAT